MGADSGGGRTHDGAAHRCCRSPQASRDLGGSEEAGLGPRRGNEHSWGRTPEEDARMTTSPPTFPDPFEDLRYALAEGDAEAPPGRLRAAVRAAALDARAAGRPTPPVPAISPLEAYRRSAARLDDLLGELSVDDWHRPALREMDVQALVGHLIGVEHHFQAGAGLAEPVEGADNHITATEPFAAAQVGRDPAATRSELRGLIDATLAG